MSENSNKFCGKHIFLTGADGFIGSHLAEALVKDGANVTALVLYNSFGTCGWLDDLSPEIRNELDIKMGDVRDSVLMRKFTEGKEIVFHLAALIGIPYSYVAAQSYVDVNIHGTLNLLEASRIGIIGKIVHTSTSEVYGSALKKPINEDHPLHGQSPYSASKIGADQMVEAYARSHNIPAVILRPFNTFGPRQSERAIIPTIIRQILDPNCKQIELGNLTTTRDFMFVDDTVRAFTNLALADTVEFGTAYNAGTGIETGMEELLGYLRDITGHKKDIISNSDRLRPDKSEVNSLVADYTKLNSLSNWHPKTSLLEGLTQCISWWKQRIAMGLQRTDNDYAR